MTVDLKLATSKAGSDVFFDRAYVYIDSSHVEGKNRCTEAEFPSASDSEAVVKRRPHCQPRP
jgi:hypothetical protein